MAMMNMVKAINLALHEALREDESVLVMGEDVGQDEGVFRVTERLLAEFGPDRVIDTPLAEGAIVGCAVGLALYGMRPICEMQFSGFAYQAYHQIEGHMSRYHNRTRGRYKMPIIIRMPYGGGIRAIEHHSESREALYAHNPGLKVLIPSGPRNARALLRAAVQQDDPVIFFEPKAVYRAFKEEVPEEPESAAIGKAEVVREGRDVTLISYGAMMRPVLEAADELTDEQGVSVEVIDLLTVSPIDTKTLTESVAKTGRVVVVHEAPRKCGVGAEVSARLVERAFFHLEAPIRRITGYDVHFPYFARERAYLPGPERIINAVRDVLAV